MSYKKAMDFYQERKDEAHGRIKEEPLFQDFKDFLDWRTDEQAM